MQYDGWKATWQWTTGPTHGEKVWGDGAELCGGDIVNQLEFLMLNCIHPVNTKARLRVCLVAPNGRRHQFIGYPSWIEQQIMGLLDG
jgi:hypothetical protein